MVKKEAGAIFAALLLVATLGVGVASAKGVEVGGGYNDPSVDTGSSTFSEFFTTDLWNGSFWDYVAEEGVAEERKEMREAEAEESDLFWLSEGKTDRPAGYWDVNPDFYKRGFSWYGSDGKTDRPAGYWEISYYEYQSSFPWFDIPGYWDVDWGIPYP